VPKLRHHNSALSQVAGGYSHAVIDGTYAFLSGQLAADATRSVIDRSTIEGETRTCMELLGAVLAEIGSGFENVVRVNVYMTDLGEFDRMNGVYESFFATGHTPARTTVGVAQLLFGCHIEIDCIAKLRGSSKKP
jgi:2-iminobutanoate/2-iminopropanoate deaminase